MMVGISRMFCFGIFLMPLVGSAYLGGLATFFGQCAQAGLEDDRPQFHWPDHNDVVLRGLVMVALTFALSILPFAALHRGLPSVLVYVLGLIPYVYWPMALAAVGLSGRLLALFDVRFVGQAIWAGGLPYLAIVAFGWAAYGVVTLGLEWSQAHPFSLLVAVGFFVVSIGYVAGAQGALIGRLIATRRARFTGFLPGEESALL
jgi:hypothetical protein